MTHGEKNFLLVVLIGWIIYGSFKGGQAYAALPSGGATVGTAPGVASA